MQFKWEILEKAADLRYKEQNSSQGIVNIEIPKKSYIGIVDKEIIAEVVGTLD